MKLTKRQRRAFSRKYRRPRKLDPEKACAIRRRYFAREATQRQLALEFGVAQSIISRVISEQLWS
jgi:DNA invertase Pin-like site-specific DNA recombinase